MDQHESLQRGEELPLKVTLSHYVSNTTAAAGVLMMDPISPKISSGGGCACACVTVVCGSRAGVSLCVRVCCVL